MAIKIILWAAVLANAAFMMISCGQGSLGSSDDADVIDGDAAGGDVLVESDQGTDMPDGDRTGDDLSIDPIRDDAGVDGTDVVPDLPAEDGSFCDPGMQWCRDDGDLDRCRDDGTWIDVVDCPLGCSPTPEAHCLEMVPSNVEDPALVCVPGTMPLTIFSGVKYMVMDSETGYIACFGEDFDPGYPTLRLAGEGLISGINFTVQSQADPDAPRLGIFSFGELHVPAGVEVLSRGANALVILSCGDVTIEGIVRAGAVSLRDPSGSMVIVPGPSGRGGGEGPGAGQPGSHSGVNDGGGGGGGYGGSGGYGGVFYGGDGGLPYGNDILVPLLGGSGGGAGYDDTGEHGRGGPGGGAIQISTPAEIHVLEGGAVETGGWGGWGGDGADNLGNGGGGGGSGGAVLLEAQTIQVSAGGIIAANGGGGGAGGNTWIHDGQNGQHGDADLGPAYGGYYSYSGCKGGNGSKAYDIYGENMDCVDYSNSGGGGGGAGRIRLNALVHLLSSGTTSPALDAVPTTATTGALTLR
jgi:hypothetical protein